MENRQFPAKGYVLALILGVFGGGLLVLMGTKAVPRMMSSIMTTAMQNVKEQMMKVGINPVDT